MAARRRQVSIATVASSIILLVATATAAAAATHPATPADHWQRRINPEVTEQGRDGRSSWSIPRRPCRLMARDPYMSDRVKQMSLDGQTHLIIYTLKFPDGSNNLTERKGPNSSVTYYKPWLGYRVLTSQGRLLLKMSFQRDAMSLGLLRSGVRELTVHVVDSPPDCFGQLPPDIGARSAAAMDLLVKDLADILPTDRQNDQLTDHSDHHGACRQIIEHGSNDVASFAFECCPVLTSSIPRSPCSKLAGNDVIDAIYYLSAAAKLVVVLFGPLLLQWLFLPHASGLVDYVVPLSQSLRKTIFVRKVRVGNDRPPPPSSSSSRDQIDAQRRQAFGRFRQLVKHIPAEQVVDVWFNQMEIHVDRRQLMAEDEVPFGLVRCLYETLVCCSCRPMRTPPLQTCCAQSVIGSWTSKLLWLPLRRRGGEVTRCCSWKSLLRAVGWLILVTAIPLPYYIRLCVFYVFEEGEMEDRRAAVDRLELSYGFDHDLFQWLTPTHGVMLGVYASYAASILGLALLRRICEAGRVDRQIAETASDLRGIRRSVCAGLLLSHFLLPFEKFGIIFGIVVGLVYWPVTLPVCLAVLACYTIPVIYVTGRSLIQTRCRCLSTLPLPTDDATSVSLSDGVTSFETCCFLDSLSASGNNSVDHAIPGTRKKSGTCSVTDALKSLVIGVVMIVLLWSVLLLYAESLGFGVEVVVMASVGVVLNSGSDQARRVVLVVWCLVYVVACYQAAVASYTQFSRVVFDAMKRRLGDQLIGCGTLRQNCRRNTAFKYFTADEMRRLPAAESSVEIQAGDVEAAKDAGRRSSLELHQFSADSIEYQSNLLHWNITSLTLFVDHRDTAHIPRDLFTRLCRLDLPASPRSGVRVICTALVRMSIAGLFLFVLGLIVELSADAETSESSKATGQTLMTLACGALPLVIHAVFTRFSRRSGSELLAGKVGTELLAGKVDRTVLNYTRSWPVFDLSFYRRTSNDEVVTEAEVDDAGEQSRPLLSDATEPKSASPRRCHDNHAPAGSRDHDPSHVDLLITIRDDDSGASATKPRGVSASSGGAAAAAERNASPVNSCLDRQTLHGDSVPASAAITSASGVGAHQSASTGGPCRPRGVTIDEQKSTKRKSGSQEEKVGFLLRKQVSASTTSLRNQVKPEAVAGNRSSCSTLVVDMVHGEGDVRAVTAVLSDSTRSLPSRSDDDDDDGCQDTQCESAL